MQLVFQQLRAAFGDGNGGHVETLKLKMRTAAFSLAGVSAAADV
jgi:hypothetical protein